MYDLIVGPEKWHHKGGFGAIGSTSSAAAALLLDGLRSSDKKGITIDAIGEQVAAAGYLLSLSSNARTTACVSLIAELKKRNKPRRPGVVRSLFGLATSPVGFAIETGLRAVGNKVVNEDEFVSEFLSRCVSAGVETQLDYVWANPSRFPRDDSLDAELGRRAFWSSFLDRDERPLWRFHPDGPLTPKIVNNALQQSEDDLRELRNSPSQLTNLWLQSPLFPFTIERINQQNRIYKRLSKGRTVGEVEQAFRHHREQVILRQRHIHQFAERMKWS